MKTLYSFYLDCGRMGDLDGLFIADSAEVDRVIRHNAYAYFGEVLGKHSEVSCNLNANMFEVKSTDQDFIQNLEELLGTSISGCNPLDCIDAEQFDGEDDECEE